MRTFFAAAALLVGCGSTSLSDDGSGLGGGGSDGVSGVGGSAAGSNSCDDCETGGNSSESGGSSSGGTAAGGAPETGGTASSGGSSAGGSASGGETASGGDAGTGGGDALSWDDPVCDDFTVYKVRPNECIHIYGAFYSRGTTNDTCFPASFPWKDCAVVTNVNETDRTHRIVAKPGFSYGVDRYEMVDGTCPFYCSVN